MPVPGTKDWLPTPEAMRVAGFVNKSTFLKVIRARHIKPIRGRRNQLCYSRGKMLELAREKEVAERRAAMARNGKLDPRNAPPTNGDIEAQVFELFNSGVEPVAVVIKLRLQADVVDQLFEKWWAMKRRGQAWLHPEQIPRPMAPPSPPPIPAQTFEAPPSIVPPVAPVSAQPSETKTAVSTAQSALDAVKKLQTELAKANG